MRQATGNVLVHAPKGIPASTGTGMGALEAINELKSEIEKEIQATQSGMQELHSRQDELHKDVLEIKQMLKELILKPTSAQSLKP